MTMVILNKDSDYRPFEKSRKEVSSNDGNTRLIKQLYRFLINKNDKVISELKAFKKRKNAGIT